MVNRYSRLPLNFLVTLSHPERSFTRKVITQACLTLAFLILLDVIAYLFFGRSLAYCPAEGDCGLWVMFRLASVVLLAVVAAGFREGA